MMKEISFLIHSVVQGTTGVACIRLGLPLLEIEREKNEYVKLKRRDGQMSVYRVMARVFALALICNSYCIGKIRSGRRINLIKD